MLFAAAIIDSPFGYIALFNQAFGEDATIVAKLCCVRDLQQKYKTSCKREASIIVYGNKHRVCLAAHYAPDSALADQDVLRHLRLSSVGFSMGELALTE